MLNVCASSPIKRRTVCEWPSTIAMSRKSPILSVRILSRMFDATVVRRGALVGLADEHVLDGAENRLWRNCIASDTCPIGAVEIIAFRTMGHLSTCITDCVFCPRRHIHHEFLLFIHPELVELPQAAELLCHPWRRLVLFRQHLIQFLIDHLAWYQLLAWLQLVERWPACRWRHGTLTAYRLKTASICFSKYDKKSEDGKAAVHCVCE
jgi:hypothetical protein